MRLPFDGMDTAANDALIAAAQQAWHPRESDQSSMGGVASTLVTTAGNQYSGVCIETGSSMGYCAEHAAVAAMVTAREYRIARIVAVWRPDDSPGAEWRVLPPCGRCREFLRQIDPANLDTEVVLGRELVLPLRDLLPHHEWPEPLDAPGTPRRS